MIRAPVSEGAAAEIITLRIITRASHPPFCFGSKQRAPHLQHVARLRPRFPRLDQAVLNKIYNNGGRIFGVRGLRRAYVLSQLHHTAHSVEYSLQTVCEKD